jgi:hypothetical protein
MTMTDDQTIKQLKDAIIKLEQKVSFLERENNRRKNEHNSVVNALRRG